jgi:tetratricopeptide (TPR) repeat protein
MQARPAAASEPSGSGDPVRQRYEQTRDRGFAKLRDGRLDEALQLLDEALEVARRTDDEALADRAFLNRCGVAISIAGDSVSLGELRKILMRNSDGVNCRLAAYNIARIYELQKEYKKGLFYARIARDRGRQLEEIDCEWVASDHNQVGNFLVAESRFEEAMEEYQQALAADPEAPAVRRSMVCGNLGYCELVLGHHRRGFELLLPSLRTFRRAGARKQMATTHLDLAFGYLEIERYRHARRHAAAALELLEEIGDSDETLKNALYLLGEACHLCGDEASARHYFERLQTSYADTPFLTEFLLAIDVRKMINLRA